MGEDEDNKSKLSLVFLPNLLIFLSFFIHTFICLYPEPKLIGALKLYNNCGILNGAHSRAKVNAVMKV